MGQTTKYHLPYPEQVDPANPPQDIRELAEATDYVFNSIPISLPAAVTKYWSATQTIVAAPPASGQPPPVAPHLDEVTIKNPAATAKLQIRVVINGSLHVESPQVLYLVPRYKTAAPPAGVAKVFNTAVRCEATAATGIVDRDFMCEWNGFLNPGVSCTFQIGAYKAHTGNGIASIRYVSLTAMSVYYTLDTLPAYPVQTP